MLLKCQNTRGRLPHSVTCPHPNLGESSGIPQRPQSVGVLWPCAPPPELQPLHILTQGSQGHAHLGQLQGCFLTDPRELSPVTEDPGDAQFAQEGFQIVGPRNGQFG